MTQPNIIQETARGLEHIQLEDSFLQKRTLFLTSDINTESCTSLLKTLMYLESEDPGEEITLYISSPGGEVTSGLVIYDYIRSMTSPVTTICIGTAASMGAIIFLAGDTRLMYPHTKIMIHDPSYGNADFSGQKPHEIQQRLSSLKDTQKSLASIIAERTGKEYEEIIETTKYDSYFNVAEAMEFGLATGIVGK